MGKDKEGTYQLKIHSDSGSGEFSTVEQFTVVRKKEDVCKESLRGPLNETALDHNRWPTNIKSMYLCPPDEDTFTRGVYCVKNTETPTVLRFAFEYYGHPESVRDDLTGFVFYEANPRKSRSLDYTFGISMDGRGVKYRRHSDLKNSYAIAPYYTDHGIAFSFDFKNNNECVLTYIGLTMRKEGRKDIFRRFVLKTDCHNNGCIDHASTQTKDGSFDFTTGTFTGTTESVSRKESMHSESNVPPSVQAAVIMTTLLVSQLMNL